MLSGIIVCSSVSEVKAQKRKTTDGPVTPVRVGSVVLNLGIGVGTEYRGDNYKTPLGMKAAVEWGLWHAGPGTITLGVETGASFSNGGPRHDDYHASTVVAGMRSAWHYGWKVKGLDTYGGVSAGIGFKRTRYHNQDQYDYTDVIPTPGIFVGASYFISPRFGFNTEAGYDITNLQLGVVFKLK